VSKFYVFLCTLPVTLARSSSDGSAVLCTSGFVGDVKFSYKGANGPESKTSRRMFRPVRQVAAPGQSLPSSTASFSGEIRLSLGYI